MLGERCSALTPAIMLMIRDSVSLIEYGFPKWKYRFGYSSPMRSSLLDEIHAGKIEFADCDLHAYPVAEFPYGVFLFFSPCQ